MTNKKWSNPKGKTSLSRFKHTGFKTPNEMQNYILQHKITILATGYNKKDKHYFLYKFGD